MSPKVPRSVTVIALLLESDSEIMYEYLAPKSIKTSFRNWTVRSPETQRLFAPSNPTP